MASITFSPSSGAPGSTVTLAGTGLTGSTEVTFNGVSASFHVVSDTQITATVPATATSGPITVTTPKDKDTSAGSFVVPVVVSPGNPLYLPGPRASYDEIDIEGGQIYAQQATTVIITTLKKLA
jgi:uncharacterized protein (TIGR03437 family)